MFLLNSPKHERMQNYYTVNIQWKYTVDPKQFLTSFLNKQVIWTVTLSLHKS